MAEPSVKRALFDEFARIGKALSSGRRAEIVDLLANGERSVESIAVEVDMSVANASQHLQILKRAGLVSARRDGTFVYYRIAAPEVTALWRALQDVAASRIAEVEKLVGAYLGSYGALEPMTAEELSRRLDAGEDLVVVDVRPAEEFEAGHIAGAISVPVGEIRRRLQDLPSGAEIVAYCRGPYCAFAHEAVRRLQDAGFRARRLREGLPDWAAAGLPMDGSR